MTDQGHDELPELRIATERLVEQVAALSVALQTVNHLQQKQLETDRRVQKAVDTAETTKTEVAQSFEDLETRTVVARALAQRKLRIFAIAASCVALLVSLTAVGFAYKVNRDRIVDQQKSRVVSCRAVNAERTKAAADSRKYFAPKLAAERANPHADGVVVSILEALANSQPQLVACPKG